MKNNALNEKSTFVKELIHFLKFSSVSISGTLLQFIIFYFLIQISNRIILNEKLADGLTTAFCYFLSTLYTYFINKYFVFKSSNNSISESVKYFAVAIPKLIITSILVPVIFSSLLPKLQEISVGWNLSADSKENIISGIKTLINAIVQTILFFVGYILSKLWVFKSDNQEQNNNN